MDIKKIVEELVDKIKDDKDIFKKFKKDPVTTIEKLIGIDLPNDQLEKVADMVKAKIDLDDLGDALKGLGGLFGKK